MEQNRSASMANRRPRSCSMRALTSHRRSALVVSLLSVPILALAGCGSGKISARQAAQKIGEYLSPSYRVRCNPASGPFWDYACTVTPPPGSKDEPYKLKVTVGPHEILDRAYCGAGRTGAPLKC